VGIASTQDGGGYWLVASDGGIFSYGDAHYHGSTGSLTLNKPVVGIASTPDGGGYWLVASDGGIFNYGDALFYGSVPGGPANSTSSNPPAPSSTSSGPNPFYGPVQGIEFDGCPTFGDATFQDLQVLADPPITVLPVPGATQIIWRSVLDFYNSSSGQWQFYENGEPYTSGVFGSPIYIPGSVEFTNANGNDHQTFDAVPPGFDYAVAGQTWWEDSNGTVIAYNLSWTPVGCDYRGFSS
jgi:hypothetical protein